MELREVEHMKKDEYISIAEFAERAGVSKQAVYKRIDKDCKPWLKVENGKKLINIKALKFFNVQPKDTVETAKEMLEETRQGYIDFLKHLVDEKNEQIKSLSKTIEREQEIVSQQQKLQAIAEQKRLQIEAHPQEITKQESLLNREKFSTEAEYQQYLLKLLPRIGMFSNRFDLKELDKVLEMMSEYERKLVFRDKRAKEAIEHIKGVDFGQLEKELAEVKKESEEFREKQKKAMQEMREQMKRERAERLDNLD